MSDADHDPSPPPADYPDLYPIAAGPTAIGLAVRLEQDAAAAWRYLYSVAADHTDADHTDMVAGPLRTSVQAALTASAIRAARWRQLITPAAATVAFPGI
jgi:hypothetical protein